MTGTLWISFVATKALIGVTPGPAVLLVVSHGLERGRTRWAALGIVLVNAFYFVLAATGLGALLSVSSEAFVAMKWIACIYLCIAGVRTFFRPFRPADSTGESDQSAWASLGTGMLLQLANPNALLFFVAVLPTFVDPHGRLAPQVMGLGATGLALDCCILAAYGTFASQLREWADTPQIRKTANRIAGALLIATAIITAAVR